MDIDTTCWSIIRIFVFLCFYAAISFGIISLKYLLFDKVSSVIRPLLVFTHVFIVTSNIAGFLAFILIDKHDPLSITLSVAGLAAAIAGASLSLWAVITLGIATFIPPENGGLITYGPFRITSHPIYFGGVIAGFGLSIWSASTLGLAYTLLILLSLVITSREEEQTLIERFGPGYVDYKKGTLLGELLSLLTGRANPN